MSGPVASERKSFLPLRLRTTSNITSPRPTTSMPSVADNNPKSPLPVGTRVLVNGLKSGTLRYIGSVQFAQGFFCGVELDQAEGKHDGQVQDIRYFQCAPNHGIFVPRDKVVVESRLRTSSSQRPISRLKPPGMTRSITLSSSIHKIEPQATAPLPDIVPNTITTNEIPMTEKEDISISCEPSKLEISETPSTPSMPVALPIEEPSETIEADFTASVSLILHQLQQEQTSLVPPTRTSSSTALSEEETDEEEEDDDDDDDDESETESVMESVLNETVQSPPTSVDRSKSVQTDLSFVGNEKVEFITSNVKTPTINNKKLNNVPIKKPIERKTIVPVAKIKTTIPTRKPAVPTTKRSPMTKTQLNSAHSVLSLPSQSKFNSSLSSLNSSQSDLRSNPKDHQVKRASQSIELPSPITERKFDETQQQELLDQLRIEKERSEILTKTHQLVKSHYCRLIDRFDLLHILSQFYMNENEQQRSKARKRNQRVKSHIDQLKSSYQHELTAMKNQYRIQLNSLAQSHQEQINQFQEKINQILDEKNDSEQRCAVLQEKVDGFLAEMANSSHADTLLCHVEHLEKDRTSLQTVLEMKTREINQLRTKLNEQTVQLEDKMTLQKRIDMVENRNQDLIYLLRQRQLEEKVALIDRDQYKEQVAQLERENRQLKFENETLLYRLHRESVSRSISTDLPQESLQTHSPMLTFTRSRARSFSASSRIDSKSRRPKRSSSWNSSSNR